jgi:hypothetical protein
MSGKPPGLSGCTWIDGFFRVPFWQFELEKIFFSHLFAAVFLLGATTQAQMNYST